MNTKDIIQIQSAIRRAKESVEKLHGEGIVLGQLNAIEEQLSKHINDIGEDAEQTIKDRDFNWEKLETDWDELHKREKLENEADEMRADELAEERQERADELRDMLREDGVA